jgi:hypothetical protein
MNTSDDECSDDIDTLKKVVCKKNVKYYYSDPTWRQKHLTYCYGRVKCDICGGEYSRNNKTNHEKGKKHKNRLNNIDPINIINELESRIQYLEDLLNNKP